MTEKENEARKKFQEYLEEAKKCRANIDSAYKLIKQSEENTRDPFGAEKRNNYRKYIKTFEEREIKLTRKAYLDLFTSCSHLFVFNTRTSKTRDRDYFCIKCGFKYIDSQYVYDSSSTEVKINCYVLNKVCNVTDFESFLEYVKECGGVISQDRKFTEVGSKNLVSEINSENPDICDEDLKKEFLERYVNKVSARRKTNYRTGR